MSGTRDGEGADMGDHRESIVGRGGGSPWGEDLTFIYKGR